MPNVLILGGSGYLGLSIAQSLLRAGTHTVWGTARTSEKAKILLANEVAPVQIDATNPDELSKVILDNSINVVVDAAAVYEAPGKILEGILQAAAAREKAFQTDGIVGPKLGFVYCSGAFVHGSQTSRINDLIPPASSLSQDKPAAMVSWRPAHEQAILAARDKLNVAILRPAFIYGRGSWVWGSWWGGLAEAAKSGSTAPVQVPVDREARGGIVHVDDAASGFHAAIDRIDGQLGSWPVFDLLAETISIPEMIENSRKTLDVKAPIEYIGSQGNVFYEALNLSTKTDASRARIVLGWTPKRNEFLLNLAVFFKAWQASQ